MIQKFPLHPLPAPTYTHTCIDSLSHYQQSHRSGIYLQLMSLHWHIIITMLYSLHYHSLLGCAFYGFGQMNNDIYPLLWYHTEYHQYPKTPLCPTNSFLSVLSVLFAASDLCLQSFAFSKMPWDWSHTVYGLFSLAYFT